MTSATMTLSGKHLIAGEASAEAPASFAATNPATSESLEPQYAEATSGEINRAMEAAQACFNEYRAMGPDKHAEFLEAIADAIEGLGEALLERAAAETGLPAGRVTGERGRTLGQTRLFAKLIREGSWVGARIDHADPDRAPLPKPDVRQCLQPISCQTVSVNTKAIRPKMKQWRQQQLRASLHQQSIRPCSGPPVGQVVFFATFPAVPRPRQCPFQGAGILLPCQWRHPCCRPEQWKIPTGGSHRHRPRRLMS